MGMDIHGMAPRSEQGSYFSNNYTWWPPLAQFCQQVAPDVCAPCKEWQTNDGDGLDNDGAIALSLSLQASVNTNFAMTFAKEWDDERYRFDVENVIKFISFLRDCGGFEIC
jgi:hypothetical protein